ncbi:MAG TPA: hypothetical protein VK968_17265, partial [Roseimicrobium sp.]|nr:hypothetical protein [Roseimicrobium sp.]
LQELPAVYANAAFHRVVSYTGAHPFTGESVSEIPKSTGKHPWSFWQATENWAALLDGEDRGLGLITPGRVHFTGGFAGRSGPNETRGNSTGYLAGQGQEILDHNITCEFRYELVAGSLKEIRERAMAVRVAGLPSWTFSNDRQGWHYQNASDNGWPISGLLDVHLDRNDPQLISPQTFWQAAAAPYLIIEAAFQTKHRTGTIYWQALDKGAPESGSTMNFPIRDDGQFHRHVIRLADSPNYRGALTRLRIDPVPAGEPGGWMKIRSIRLAKESSPTGNATRTE